MKGQEEQIQHDKTQKYSTVWNYRELLKKNSNVKSVKKIHFDRDEFITITSRRFSKIIQRKVYLLYKYIALRLSKNKIETCSVHTNKYTNYIRLLLG